MSKKEKKRLSFDDYYRYFYGDRWEILKAALLKPLSNYHALQDGLLKPYYLDQASFQAASSLPLEENDQILDLCAAPGGKSLVLALTSEKKKALSLTVNEFSSLRKARLVKVLSEHLPKSLLEKIQVTGYDGSLVGKYQKASYHKILVDAPCSGERHLLQSPVHLQKWSEARTKSLAIRQFALLASAFDALKEGGFLLYSTCSLSPCENDGVIEKLLKKRAGVLVFYQGREQERVGNGLLGSYTRYGIQILPDIDKNGGPIYYSLIQKEGFHS